MRTKTSVRLLFARASLAALLWIAIAIIAACGGPSNEPQATGEEPTASTEPAQEDITTNDHAPATWSVAHEMGTLELDAVPSKIVVLDTYLLDIALALGIQPTGVAAESAGQQELPPYLQEYVDYEITWVGARNDPNLEMLADLEPDLIVADLQRHQESYEILGKIAPTFVVTGSGAEDWKTIITKLGEVIQEQEKAAAVIEDFEQMLEEGKAMLADKGKLTVAPVTLYPKSQVRIYTEDSYTGAILQGLGFELSHEADGKQFEELSVEVLGDIPADAFVLLQSPQYTADVDPGDYPVFSSLPTVKAGQAFTVGMEQWAFYRGPLAGKVIIREALEIFSN